MPLTSSGWVVRSGRGGSRLPERAEHEADHRGHRKRRHRLGLDGLVARALEVAGTLLHALARLAAGLGEAVGYVLGLIGHVAELIAGLVGHLVELVGRLFLDLVRRRACHVECSLGLAEAVRITPCPKFSSLR